LINNAFDSTVTNIVTIPWAYPCYAWRLFFICGMQ